MATLRLPRFDPDRTRAAAWFTASGLVLGLLGPFGSYLNGSPVVRMAYWVACLWAGVGLLSGIRITVAPWIEGRAGQWAVPASLALAVLLASVPAALLSRLVATGLWPGPIARVPPAEWWGQTLLVLSGLALGRSALAGVVRPVLAGPGRSSLAGPGRSAAPPPPASPPLASPPVAGRLLDRLPRPLGRDVVALQMEDHYVRVHTRAGSALVLMPLRQAIREVEHRPGLAVHRSWWVAHDAVTGCRRDGRNLRLVLVGGLVVPVARARLAAAREAGLVGDET